MAVARHQSFISSHLTGGLAALCVFPIYLATIGQPSLMTAIAFAWLVSPIAIALYLSKTGKLGAAYLISALNLTGLVTFAAAISGGLASFLLPWMIVVPLEAALSADRRILLAATGLSGLGILVLALGTAFDLLPVAQPLWMGPSSLALVGLVSAVAYAGGLAFNVQILHARSEDEIRTGEQRYRLLAENTTDMITRHAANGKVTFASMAAEHILGETPDRLIEDGLFERVHVADRPFYLNALATCLSEERIVSLEFRLKKGETPDYVWVEMRCKPIGVEGESADGTSGGASEIVAVTRDITERKDQEIELLKARDEAESASQSKTQFLANMSHELRTPLNAIIGFSEILTRELYGPLGEERYNEYANLIHESGEHLLTVVNEILDMSKIEAGKFTIIAEPFEVTELVRSTCDILAHGAEQKSIHLDVAVPPGPFEIVADRRACRQMLLNLLANAIKFTDTGGGVQVALCRCGDQVELSVADDGIGIAPEDLPKLGNPFVQAETSYNRSYEGTGLGLSVVRGLAELHGGKLAIESQLGVGTRVTVHLPIECSVSEDAEPQDVADAQPLRIAAGA